LGSKVSTWLAPPCKKMKMTLLALPGNAGGLGDKGLTVDGVVSLNTLPNADSVSSR